MVRGLLRAVLLLAPALSTTPEDNAPAAFIQLDIPHTEGKPVEETSFRFDVFESELSCGYGNVKLNGHALDQDEAGVGSGSITTDQSSIIVASSKFTCVGAHPSRQEQLMEFDVQFVDGKQIEDLGFSVQFQQTSPTWVTFVAGAESVIRAPKLDFPSKDFADRGELDAEIAEIAELEYMKWQMVELEQAIFMKEQFLAEAFGFDKTSKVTGCDSLKCMFLSVYDQVKDAASKFYAGESFFGGRHGGPHEPLGHHGNHTQDNHTSPPPPFKPHPPPRSTILLIMDRPRSGTTAEHLGRLQNSGNTTYRRYRSTTGLRLRLTKDHHLPFLNMSTQVPLMILTVLMTLVASGTMTKRSISITRMALICLRLSTMRLVPPSGNGPSLPHFNFRHFVSRVPFQVVAAIVLFGFLASALHTRCFTVGRRQCRARRKERHRQFRERDTYKAKFLDTLQRLKESLSNLDADDEGMEAMMRRIYGHEDDSEALSTTMEEELAEFRNAVGVVDDMIAAEEGRAERTQAQPREMSQYQQTMPVSPSPMPACPDNMSSFNAVDEALPADDEESKDSSFPADDMLSMYGGSTYNPSESSASGFLGDVLRRKD